ncbi:TPA: hypothetical protein N0F65_009980, partial [Lagenidium giganteum]
KSVHTAATPSSSPTKASKSDSPTKSTKPGVSKFQPQLETDDFEVVDTSRNSGNGDDDDDDDDGAGGDEEMVDDWLDPEASPSVAVSCDSSSPKKTLSGNANVAPVATAHTPLAPRNMAAPKPFHSAPINDVATSYHNAPPPALRQPSVLAVGGMNGGLSPTRQLAPVQSPIPTNHSPTKPGSYRASIVATNGMPVVLPIVDPNAAGIRDTKVVKKKKAELPQGNLPHPQPKFGDWLNSRTMINNYIILESLGAGSYAEVKLCKEKMSGKLYAMKFINRDIMKKDKLGKQSKLDDIKREIAIMKKLHHPNVLRLYEVMDDPKMNKLFLVLEYMKHGDLLGHQRKKYEKLHGSAQANASATQLNDRDIHCVTLQILLGLAYLHEQKIVHGDIKPQNLLVGDNDVVKIADFGISQTLYGSKQKLTDSTGTPAFMSPEMCSGEEYSGQMADIWAVGATVFMLKFGNPPFVAKSAMQMFEKIQKDPLVFPAAIDPMFEDLLRGMLTKDPQRRMTLLQVMTHPWVTKDEHHSNFSIRQPAPQITVSKDDIDHAIDADRFKIIVDIRIQMMKRLHHAREEVVKAHNARESQLKHALLHDQGPSSPRAGEQSSPLSAIAHRTNKIHISTEDEPQPVRSNDEVEEDRKMLSSEEIHYRAQMFSRKKPSAATSACSSPSNASVMAKKDAVHTSGDQDHDSAAASDLGDVEEDCLSSDEEDGNAVAQSPQLLDELLLTTLSMPPLSTSHSEGYLASGNWSAVHHAHASSTLSLLDAPSFFAESPSLSMSFAVTSLEGRRNTQEDRWVVLPSLQETAAASGSETADIWAHSAFVGLYDGHGGEECANILQEQLHSWLFRMPDDYFAHPEKLEKCFLELDSFVCDYLLHKGDLSGSTATCMIFSPAKTPGKVLVTVGHVGDCRLVLCRRNGENVDITNDHRLTHADERQRILALGGRVVNNRVNGVMAITRAFGDLEFKGMIGRMKPGSFISAPSSPGPPQFNPFQLEEEKIPALLTARPDISMLELDAKTDEFLVLACDGLWDVMTSEEAREIIRDRFHLHRDLQLVAKELAQEAIRRYSNDNITVVLMRLVDGAIDAPTTVIHAERLTERHPQRDGGSIRATMLELHKLFEEFSTRGKDKKDITVFDDRAFRLGKYCDGALIKFRGIVQDVHDPELVYLAAEGDAAPSEEEIIRSAADVGKGFVERIPLKVAVCPQLTEWATALYSDGSAGSDKQEEMPSGSKGTKRALEDDTETEATSDAPSGTEADTKRSKADVAQADDAQASESHALAQNVVNVYVYEGQYRDLSNCSFKVNESFEFVGVLDLQVAGVATMDSEERSLTVDELQQLQISDCFESMQRKQSTGAAVHCCDATVLNNLHFLFPNQPAEFYRSLDTDNAMKLEVCKTEWLKCGLSADVTLQDVRSQLVRHLANQLRGDKLAAEYVLLCLLSRVYSRVDASTPLGNLSVNLAVGKNSNAEQNQRLVETIEKALAKIVPLSMRIDLSIQKLNESKYMPKKDYETERLHGGLLQVPHGTTLLVNETILSTGQLDDQGVKNLAALQSVVSKMLLPYDFQFYSMDFPQDVAVVSVSETNSILPMIASVPLVASADEPTDSTTTDQLRGQLSVASWERCFQVYLGVLRSLKVTIGNEQAEIAEKHFVDCRKSRQEVSSDDLHRWLRLARLLSLSYGEETLTTDRWNAMLALEEQRITRVDNA